MDNNNIDQNFYKAFIFLKRHYLKLAAALVIIIIFITSIFFYQSSQSIKYKKNAEIFLEFADKSKDLNPENLAAINKFIQENESSNYAAALAALTSKKIIEKATKDDAVDPKTENKPAPEDEITKSEDKTQELKQAVALLRQAVKNTEDNTLNFFLSMRLVRLYTSLLQFDKAQQLLDEAKSKSLNLIEKGWADLIQADLYFAMDKKDDAVKIYRDIKNTIALPEDLKNIARIKSIL